MGNSSSESQQINLLSLELSHIFIKPIKAKLQLKIDVKRNNGTGKDKAYYNNSGIKHQIRQMKNIKAGHLTNRDSRIIHASHPKIYFTPNSIYLKQDQQIRFNKPGYVKAFWQRLLADDIQQLSIFIKFTKQKEIKRLNIHKEAMLQLNDSFKSYNVVSQISQKLIDFSQQNQKINSYVITTDGTLPKIHSYQQIKHLCVVLKLQPYQRSFEFDLFIKQLVTHSKIIQTLKLDFCVPLNNQQATYFVSDLSKLPNLENLYLNVQDDSKMTVLGFTLKETTLTFPKLKTLAFKVFPRMVGDNQLITIFDIYQVKFPMLEEALVFIEQGRDFDTNRDVKLVNIYEMVKGVKRLRFSTFDKKISCETIQQFLEDLPKLTRLEELSLRSPSKPQDSYKEIITSLTKLSQLKKLVLDLKENSLNQDGAKAVGNALSKMEELEYLKLNLSENLINTQGFSFLNQGISNLKHLKEASLHLEQNQEFQKSSMLDSFLYGCTSLTKLHLNFNRNIIYQGFFEFLGESLGYLDSLQNLSIYLSQLNLKNQSIAELFKFFYKLENLTESAIELKESNLRNEDIKLICQNISKSKSITQLRLDASYNRIDREANLYDKVRIFYLLYRQKFSYDNLELEYEFKKFLTLDKIFKQENPKKWIQF